jgi:hypothetical protein
MKKRIYSVLAIVLAVSIPLTAMAGKSAAPGVGPQTTGATTQPGAVSNAAAVQAVSTAMSGTGATNAANAIAALPGSTQTGAVTTSPPITLAGGQVVVVAINTATGTVTITNANGDTIFQS